jgi:uncharacterized cupin superfamily protein
VSNIWSDDWDSLGETEWEAGAKSTRLPRGDVLGASIYELPPGGRSTYHFHHGSEELLIALRGRITLRTPEGERDLEEGDVVHFGTGPDGAHEQLNRTDAPIRYVVVSNRVSPEVVEYPDLEQVTAQSRHDSQHGERLFVIHDLPKSD